MDLMQKIVLSIMIVLAVFGLFLGVVGATQIDYNKKAYQKTCRLIALVFLTFVVATVIFVLGFIW